MRKHDGGRADFRLRVCSCALSLSLLPSQRRRRLSRLLMTDVAAIAAFPLFLCLSVLGLVVLIRTCSK